MAKLKNKRIVIQSVIKKINMSEKKEIVQLTIKIDKRIDSALIILSKELNISKNRLIESIIYENVLSNK